MSEGVSKNSKAKKKRAVLCIVSLRLLKMALNENMVRDMAILLPVFH